MSLPRLAPFALLALLLAAGCADKIANQCPNTPALHCLAGTVCENDPTRGCQVCRCASPGYVPVTQPPQGAPEPGVP